MYMPMYLPVFPCIQVYILMVWNFELYMIPLSLLIVFMKNLLVVQIVGNLMKDKEESVRDNIIIHKLTTTNYIHN